MSLNTLSLHHTATELASGEPQTCERLNKAGKGVCVAITLLVFNTVMLLSGALEDAFKLEALLSDGFIVEPLLLNLAQFLAHPIISEDAFKLEALLSDGFIVEPLLLNLAQFLAHPIISSQLLIGLCWLLFHICPARRAGIILRKAAFAFSEAKVQQPVISSHGCRAPPSFTGCL